MALAVLRHELGAKDALLREREKNEKAARDMYHGEIAARRGLEEKLVDAMAQLLEDRDALGAAGTGRRGVGAARAELAETGGQLKAREIALTETREELEAARAAMTAAGSLQAQLDTTEESPKEARDELDETQVRLYATQTELVDIAGRARTTATTGQLVRTTCGACTYLASRPGA